jgi:hypothetical protein
MPERPSSIISLQNTIREPSSSESKIRMSRDRLTPQVTTSSKICDGWESNGKKALTVEDRLVPIVNPNASDSILTMQNSCCKRAGPINVSALLKGWSLSGKNNSPKERCHDMMDDVVPSLKERSQKWNPKANTRFSDFM